MSSPAGGHPVYRPGDRYSVTIRRAGEVGGLCPVRAVWITGNAQGGSPVCWSLLKDGSTTGDAAAGEFGSSPGLPHDPALLAEGWRRVIAHFLGSGPSPGQLDAVLGRTGGTGDPYRAVPGSILVEDLAHVLDELTGSGQQLGLF